MNVNDNINMEYEARVMVNEEQYYNILEHYLHSGVSYERSINQNFYYDTKDLKLTNSHKVLRARKINDRDIEITLKIQGESGAIEINHKLTDNDSEETILNIIRNHKPIADKLLEVGIDPSDLKYITTLRTNRVEFELENCLLVVDENFYRGKIDWNIEVESDTENHAKEQLIAIIKPFDIEYKKDYINKARRAIYNL